MTHPTPIKPVPICYLIGSLARCGTAIHLLAVLRTLDRSRYSPWVVCMSESGEVAGALRELGIEVVELGLRSIYAPRTWGSVLRVARQIRVTGTPIVHSYLFFENFLAPFVARLGGASRVITGRRTVDEWESPRHRFLYRLTNPLISRIVVVSHQVAESVHRWENPNPAKVVLIGNALSKETLAARHDPADNLRLTALDQILAGGFVFGTVGNVRPIKGHDLFVRAFARVRAAHTHAHCVIVGAGPFLTEVRRLVKDLGLTEVVHLEGHRANIAGYLDRFSAFVLPSRAEGMSNALLEALLMGKPSISTAFGLPRSADGSEVVLSVPPEDVEALAVAMERILVDSSLRERLSQAARAYADEVMDEGRMVRSYEALYEELLG